MSSTTPSLRATDLLAVKSRVSWGAIAAGAMVALSVYLLLTFIGIAVGLEAARNPRASDSLGAGTTIFVILSLLISMFFGGWATSRLAVGESKLEAILYGIILWGVLFVGMFWLVSAGFSAGFGGVMSLASGAANAASEDSGASQGATNRLMERIGDEKFVDDLTKLGVDQEKARQYQSTLKDRIATLRDDPASLPGKVKEDMNNPAVQQAASRVADVSRQAAWYSLAGVVLSMAAVILGSLIGSGDLPVPVPILGVRRAPVGDPRT